MEKLYKSGRKSRMGEQVVNVTPILPTKSGYVQFDIIPVKIKNGIVSNARTKVCE